VSRLPTAVACALCAAALAACNSPENERGSGAGERGREVARTVESLERAIARRDFRAVCRDLFTRAVREQAGGRACPSMLRRTSRGLRRPRIRIRSVSLRGERAVAEVTTLAAGQTPARDTIQLVREGGRWRVAALGG